MVDGWTFRRIVVGRFEFTKAVKKGRKNEVDARYGRTTIEKKTFNLICNSILLVNTWKVSVRSKFSKLLPSDVTR